MFKNFKEIKPHIFFVGAAILLGLCYNFFKPPFQSPDEFNHFLRAYQVSEGKFMPEKKDRRLGGELPVCLKGFKALFNPTTSGPEFKISRKEIAEGFAMQFSESERVFMDFPNTSYYSPVCYLPQAVTLFFFRQFNCSVGTMYYGTKIIVFIIWLLSMVFVIRTLPLYKWLFTTLFLLPMNLYITTSFSADTVTNSLSFILLAVCINCAFREKALLKRDFFFLLLVGVLLAFTKVIYVSLLLLLLLIPASNFKTTFHKYAGITGIISLCFLAGYAWSGTIMHYFISYQDYNPDYRLLTTLHPTANYSQQKQHLVEHGFHFFRVFFNTTFGTAGFYLSSYIGQFGTFMDTKIPVVLVVISYIFLIAIALIEKSLIGLSWRKKLILFLTALSSFALVILSQHLIWNGVGNDIADSIQGRYLIPVLPLIFMLFNNGRIKLKINTAWIVIIFLCLVNGLSCKLLYERYFKEIYTSKMNFSSDMENVDGKNNFETSDSKITLEGGEKRTNKEHRSGKYSMLLLPDSSIGANYHFKDVHEGDLVEVYAWEKGGRGEIVMTGHGLNCAPYYFINKDIQIEEKSGWKRIQLIFSMFVKCDSSEVTFFLQNPTKDTVYIDDIRYCVKKIK